MPDSRECSDYPPSDYRVPRFPSLCWPPHSCLLYTVYDSWRFTLLWTLIIFTVFHLGATAIALLVQVGKPRSIWKYLVAIPIAYAIVAGVEALVAGSVVGSILGAVYTVACYKLSTWIPFIWGFINVLILIISSFTIQGGL
ncbi:integral membrane protein [Xylaria intraflava]|nr:integral membrane protein [Xylaria intraflava]